MAGLAEIDRVAHLPALASAMVDHAVFFEHLGRSTESLDHSRRAVDRREEPARHGHVTHLPALAASVRTHGRRSLDAGQETREFTRRVAEAYGEPAAHDRAAHLHDAAMAAGYHSMRLSEAGHTREALECSQRVRGVLDSPDTRVGERIGQLAPLRRAARPGLAFDLLQLDHQRLLGHPSSSTDVAPHCRI
ncbi:hypothetical protein ACSHWB_36055 [Lentzea sp. HUAS TT2]|uniref:hypothetical protein n=1 Tax=Lentzea sp. HUAS TT2 TaxID=3447454 RepID=UPI003F72B03D